MELSWYQEPSQGMQGEIEMLRSEYRLALADDSYLLVRGELAVFRPGNRDE